MVAGMARANRLRGDGGVFHLTHRCHNRAFLLKFARDRDAYRAKAREHLQQFDVSVLDYCVTSNHVHLLVDASERLEVSGFMREVASELPGLTTSARIGPTRFVETTTTRRWWRMGNICGSVCVTSI